MQWTFLTLNTWMDRGPWKERWEVILPGIKKLSPDIITFQELFDADWALEMQKRSGYEHLFFPKGHAGLTIFSRYPILDSREIQMKTKSPFEEYFRYAVFTRIQLPGQTVSVFNTHLSWKLADSTTRQQQVEQLQTLISECAGEDPVIAAGDYNAVAGTPEIESMIQRAGFTDSFARLHPGNPGITWAHRNPFTKTATGLDGEDFLPERRLDYIFMRGDALLESLQSVEIVFDQPDERGIHASDHFGLLAKGKWGEPS